MCVKEKHIHTDCERETETEREKERYAMSCQAPPYESLNKSTGEIERLRKTERDREKVPEKGRKTERDTKC